MTARGPAPSFAARVIIVVRAIPSGRVATYGDVARMAGRPRAARGVGQIMSQCTDRSVPCHRVIAAGGRLGGFGGSEEFKRRLLQAEGLLCRNGRVRNFAELRWSERVTSAGQKKRASAAGGKKATL